MAGPWEQISAQFSPYASPQSISLLQQHAHSLLAHSQCSTVQMTSAHITHDSAVWIPNTLLSSFPACEISIIFLYKVIPEVGDIAVL